MAEETDFPQPDAPGVSDAEPDQPVAGEGDQPADPAPRDRVSERFAKLTRALSQKDRDIAALRDEIARVRDERVASPPSTSPAPTGKPQVADYQDYDAYVEAVAGWQAEQKFQEREVYARQQAELEARRTQSRMWEERVLAAQTKYDDWDDVLQGADVPVTPSLRDALLESEQGADVLYYLASHQQEARQLSTLGPVAVARAIGRIEAKLERGDGSPASTAPPPIPAPVRPVGTSTSGGARDPSAMSPQEYRAWRERQRR